MRALDYSEITEKPWHFVDDGRLVRCFHYNSGFARAILLISPALISSLVQAQLFPLCHFRLAKSGFTVIMMRERSSAFFALGSLESISLDLHIRFRPFGGTADTKPKGRMTGAPPTLADHLKKTKKRRFKA